MIRRRSVPPLTGVESVFLYAEASCIDAFVDAAVRAGVSHVVLLSSSSITEPGAEHDMVSKSHLDVERALEQAPFTSTSLRPGAFATNALPWAWEIRSTGGVALPFPESCSAPIEIRPVSRVEARAHMVDFMAEGYADALLDMWERSDGVPAEVTATVGDIAYRPQRTFRRWALDHEDAFTS